MQKRKTIKIAFLDITTAFGGAIISLSHLVNNLDRTMYEPLLFFEMDPAIVDHLFNDDIPRRRIKHVVDYMDWQRASRRIMALRIGFFRKLLLYSFSAIRNFFTVIYVLKIVKICRGHGVEILHVNNGSGIMEGFLIARILGIPVIVHQRGETGGSMFTRYFYRHTDAFIAISRFIRGTIVSNGGSLEKIRVIHNPVEVPHMGDDKLRESHNIAKEDICIGVFGRIITWKGQEIFIRAAIELLKRHSRLKIFLIGDASDSDKSYYRKVRRLAAQSPNKDRIIFTGYVQNVGNYYNLMDIVAHTSISPEPFGRVIIEAMIYGKPVLASDEGGPREIITDGVDGFLVPPGDAVFLEHSLERLIGDRELRQVVGEKARNKALEHFTSQAHAEKVSKIYDEMKRIS